MVRLPEAHLAEAAEVFAKWEGAVIGADLQQTGSMALYAADGITRLAGGFSNPREASLARRPLAVKEIAAAITGDDPADSRHGVALWRPDDQHPWREWESDKSEEVLGEIATFVPEAVVEPLRDVVRRLVSLVAQEWPKEMLEDPEMLPGKIVSDARALGVNVNTKGSW